MFSPRQPLRFSGKCKDGLFFVFLYLEHLEGTLGTIVHGEEFSLGGQKAGARKHAPVLVFWASPLSSTKHKNFVRGSLLRL